MATSVRSGGYRRIADQEGPRRTSRRQAVAGTLAAVGGGVVALATGRDIARIGVAAQEFASDLDVLNFLLAIEYAEAALYREALRTFDEAAFAAANRPGTVRPNLEAIREQEQEHVKTLAALVADRGGSAAEPARYGFEFADLDGFLQVAATIENAGVAAFAGALPAVGDSGLLATLLGIHSVEARHAGYLNARIEVSPFPAAVDQPASPAETTDLLDDYVAAAEPTQEAEVEAEPTRPPRRREETTPVAEPTAAADTSTVVTAKPPVAEAPGISGATSGPAADPGADEPMAGADEPIAEAPEDESAPTPEATAEAAEGEGNNRRFEGVVDDAAVRLGVAPSEVEIVSSERQEWPDSALGCPAPDELYTPVITPGFLVIVAAGDTELEYHTDRKGGFVLCQDGAPAA